MRTTVYHVPGCRVRLVHLSDMHGRPFDEAIARAAACKPDLIAVTGDVLNRHRFDYRCSPLDAQAHALPFLAACAALAPTFFSLGNHEWMLDEDDLQRIRDTGVTLLDNEYRTVRIAGQSLVLGGLTSARCLDYRRQRAAADGAERYPARDTPHGLAGIRANAELAPDTDWLADFAAAPGWHVLLSHHPEYFPRFPASVELILSGHAHGGQWAYYSPRKKRMCGVLAPGQGLFPQWTKGVYENRLLVSAGLSNTSFPVPRLCNPTEVVVVEGRQEA